MKPADLTLKRISIPSGDVSIFDEGIGETVVFVHGYPGRPQDFRWLTPLLPGVRAVGIALPGLDLTPLSTAPAAGVPERGQFLSAVLDALSIQRCVLVGHSMGGGLVAEVAARQPERVAGLALISSIGMRPHKGIRRSPAGLISRIASAPVLSTVMRPLVVRGFQQLGFPRGISWEAMQHTLRCAAAIDFSGLRESFASVSAPTMVAWTEDDALIETAVFEELATALPDGPRVSWPTGGHASVKSRAAELAAVMRPWLLSLG